MGLKQAIGGLFSVKLALGGLVTTQMVSFSLKIASPAPTARGRCPPLPPYRGVVVVASACHEKLVIILGEWCCTMTLKNSGTTPLTTLIVTIGLRPAGHS